MICWEDWNPQFLICRSIYKKKKTEFWEVGVGESWSLQLRNDSKMSPQLKSICFHRHIYSLWSVCLVASFWLAVKKELEIRILSSSCIPKFKISYSSGLLVPIQELVLTKQDNGACPRFTSVICAQVKCAFLWQDNVPVLWFASRTRPWWRPSSSRSEFGVELRQKFQVDHLEFELLGLICDVEVWEASLHQRCLLFSNLQTAKKKKVVYTGYVLHTGLSHQFGASLEDARSLNGSSVLHVTNCHVLPFLYPIFS
jgi:hypothetical protein